MIYITQDNQVVAKLIRIGDLWFGARPDGTLAGPVFRSPRVGVEYYLSKMQTREPGNRKGTTNV